ncbi:hypothetical protein LSAT2_022908, partial [Lamellibrachia satsuma]
MVNSVTPAPCEDPEHPGWKAQIVLFTQETTLHGIRYLTGSDTRYLLRRSVKLDFIVVVAVNVYAVAMVVVVVLVVVVVVVVVVTIVVNVVVGVKVVTDVVVAAIMFPDL